MKIDTQGKTVKLQVDTVVVMKQFRSLLLNLKLKNSKNDMIKVLAGGERRGYWSGN